MKLSLPVDLTQGRPLPTLVTYAVPMLISMFFQQAYNLVDSWIAGTCIGEIALGAVGTCYPLSVFFIAIASGLSLGTSIFCSREYGARRFQQVRTGVSSSYLCFIPLSLLLCAAGMLLSPWILRLLAVPDEALSATRSYLLIYLAGFPFLFLYNISNSVLTGLGDSRTPLFFLILSSTCNIVLDLVFVRLLPWGVSGLAFATLLSQAIASVPAFCSARQACRFPSAGGAAAASRSGLFSAPVLKELLALGIPSMLQHLFMSAGQLFLQSIINSYGLIVLAGYSVAFRMNGIVINSLMALSNALSGFMAQNLGAAQYRRVSQGVKISLFLAFGFSLCVAAVFLAAGRPILEFFIKDSPDKAAVVSAGMGFLRVISPFYLLVCVKIVFDGALRGVGAMTPFMAATMSDVVVRILCGRLFSGRWGIGGVWAIWPLAWLVGTAMSVGLYLICRRKSFPADRERPSKT